jgi:phage terminase large subunit-like protein
MIFSTDPSKYPDPSGRAERVCRFLRNLTLWEGDFAGEAFRLHPFQEAIVRRIYGPTRPDGGRLVRTACIWIPRGNAKTTLAAGLGLAHFMGPEKEDGGQVIAAAADRENAGIAFNCAHQFVLQDDELAARVKAAESRKTMKHPKSASVFKAISSEAYSKHGMNCSFFLADEIHAWPTVDGRKLFGVVTDSMVKRSAPLTVIISTAGEGTGGLAADRWLYSQQVARGEIEDPSFAPIIFAADPNADWQDEAAWRAANPAIDAGFCSIYELRTKAKQIQHFPGEVADFKRFHLNIWQEGAGEPWIGLDLYDAAEAMTPLEDLHGRRCWVGIDLSNVSDLSAVVAVFPDGEGEARRYDVLAKFFLPAENLKRKADQDRANYLAWEQAGILQLTPGNVIDYSQIVFHAVELAETFDAQEFDIDRWNSTAISNALQAEGLTVVECGQGFASMAAPVKELKRAILAGGFRHGGNAGLRSCFANVVTEKDAAENEKFTKAKARGRIDGSVAAAMAVGRILANDTGPSVYETDRPNGVLFV